MAASQRSSKLLWIYGISFFLVLALSLLLTVLPGKKSAPVGEHQDYAASLPAENKEAAPSGKPDQPAPLPAPAPGDSTSTGGQETPPLPSKPRILYFVMDDGGHNLGQLQKFLKFPGKITIAVMPFLAHSEESARLVRQAGKSLILHMPMEALNQDAGTGAILSGTPAETVRKKLEEALASVPGAQGVNNHMGSKATADGETMKAVLSTLKSRGLFFLDSLTNPASKARAAGEALNITVWERDVFLDNEKNREYILQAIEDGKKTADQKGHAVMIGHVWTSELAEVLTEIYPQLLDQGYTLEDLPYLFSLPDDDESTGY